MKKQKACYIFCSIAVALTSCGQTTSSISQESSSLVSSVNNSENTSVSSSSVVVKGRDIFASPNGGGTEAKGTKDSPYNLGYAISLSTTGHTLFLLGGTYKSSVPIKFDKTTETYLASSEAERKTLAPALNEDGSEQEVVFDFTSMEFNTSNRGLSFNTDYWHAKDFEVKGAGDNGVYVGGNYNIIENLNIHDCQDSGLQLGRKSSSNATMDSWPAYNTIKNCTSHDNHDPTGEDSDGFACKLTTGVGNVFDGCMAYNNVDDGWDLYAKGETGPIGAVTLKNCVSFNNGITSYGIGTANSDGNGFKLGGETIAVAHKVYNCIAFNNLAHGFTDNSNPGTIRIENCTSVNNGTRDWDCNNFDTCRDTATSVNYYKNCLSYCFGNRTSPITGETSLSNSKDQYKGTASYSVFYYGLAMLKFDTLQACDYSINGQKGTLINQEVPNPFVSYASPQPQSSKGVDSNSHENLHKKLRGSDGSVKLGDFLKVSSSSIFYTMGENGTCLGADLSGGNK
jgi:hypothetical protein